MKIVKQIIKRKIIVREDDWKKIAWKYSVVFILATSSNVNESLTGINLPSCADNSYKCCGEAHFKNFIEENSKGNKGFAETITPLQQNNKVIKISKINSCLLNFCVLYFLNIQFQKIKLIQYLLV